MISRKRAERQFYDTTLIAIDPGVRASGVAIFRDGSLARAAWVKGEESAVVLWAQNAVRGVPTLTHASKTVCMIEEPIVVRGRAFRGKTESLLQLSQTIGALRVLFEALSIDVRRVPVREWKRTVPTEALHERLEKKLDEYEKSVIEWPTKSASHNVVDAISIGLWALGR